MKAPPSNHRKVKDKYGPINQVTVFEGLFEFSPATHCIGLMFINALTCNSSLAAIE